MEIVVLTLVYFRKNDTFSSRPYLGRVAHT